MLLVKTYVMYSEIDGFGLFAHEDIELGSTVWEYNPVMDKTITDKEFKTLPRHIQTFLEKYSHIDNGYYHIWLDNTRFMNHSDNPNCYCDGNIIYANQDIKEDEELTIVYSTFPRNGKGGRED